MERHLYELDLKQKPTTPTVGDKQDDEQLRRLHWNFTDTGKPVPWNQQKSGDSSTRSGKDKVFVETKVSEEQRKVIDCVQKASVHRPFDVLGLPENATKREAMSAYRKQSLLLHPDQNRHPQAAEIWNSECLTVMLI